MIHENVSSSSHWIQFVQCLINTRCMSDRPACLLDPVDVSTFSFEWHTACSVTLSLYIPIIMFVVADHARIPVSVLVHDETVIS